MSDAFVEPTPAEIHHTLLQFMGQNMGEFKKLDETLINKTNTLQGMTLQPRQVLNTIPVPQQPPQTPAPQQPQYIVPTQVNIPIQQSPAAEVPAAEVRDPNDPEQLEFNFNSNPLSKSIFSTLREIQETLEANTLLLNKVIDTITAGNKKKEKVS